jgi:hypothetical protein
MKIATKVIFASALMFSVVAPSLSYAAYFVDQTKTWALETRAQDVTGKASTIRAIGQSGLNAFASVPRSGAAFNPNDPAVTGGGSPGYNELLGNSHNY